MNYYVCDTFVFFFANLLLHRNLLQDLWITDAALTSYQIQQKFIFQNSRLLDPLF